MVTSIIERAAQALAALQYGKSIRDCENPCADPVFIPTPWDSLSEKLQTDCIDQARAIFSAIREPSAAMVDEGEVCATCPEGSHVWAAEICWQAMIDAALSEGG